MAEQARHGREAGAKKDGGLWDTFLVVVRWLN